MLNTLSEAFATNTNFRSAINLELDLDSSKKIEEYIPTTATCAVLKNYVETLSGQKKDYATLLVGPYGKGKSFLLLVLSYIIGNRKKDNTYKTLLKKIKLVDPDLAREITDLKKVKLLPILINAGYEDLNQSFMLGLNEALKREGITDIIPENAYQICLDVLNRWDNDTHISNVALNACTTKYGINLDDLKKELNEHSPAAYKQFYDLYNCVIPGVPFNPLVNDDIKATYRNVTHELTDYGYSGIFIIFDEFSKFLESSGNSLMRNLKILQDIAELAENSSQTEQIHICCVTHKSLDLYSSDKDKNDAFKTVEGRFKEIIFNRSLEENYQMISAAIIRKDETAAEIQYKDYRADHNEFYKHVVSSPVFSGDTDFDTLFGGCYPFNPLTVYTLIQLSEKVAQNERTLFTFISDTDENSLNSFLYTKDSVNELFHVDKIYDYFSAILKRENDPDIRRIWIRSEATLSNIDKYGENAKETIRIIKSLAVVLMVNDASRLPSTNEILSLCTGIDIAKVDSIVEDLIGKHYLRRNMINDLLSFATANSKSIDEKINNIMLTKQSALNIASVAQEVDENKYILPHRYNEENKMTRFYSVVYLTEEQFSTLNSFRVLRDRVPGDGVVINLVRESLKQDEINKKVSGIKDPVTIVRYPESPVEPYFVDELKRYAALKQILLDGDNDEVLTSEIELLKDETVEDIKQLINQYYGKNSLFACYAIHANRLNSAISDQLSSQFSKKIIFNNELFNKNKLTIQYQKAVNHYMQWLIDGAQEENWNYSLTSPESTVKETCREAFKQSDTNEVVDEIMKLLIDAEKESKSVSELVAHYQAEPYGIRKGIVPILIAKAISQLNINIILYLRDKEIDLTAENISKAVFSESEYSFRSAKGSGDQVAYLDQMLQLFNVPVSSNFRENTKQLANAYRRFFVGLPMIVRTAGKNNPFGFSSEIVTYKNEFLGYNLNPYEQVYQNPLEIFEADNYAVVSGSVEEFYHSWEKKLDEFELQIAGELKKLISIDETTSLKKGLQEYLLKTIGDAKPVLNETSSRIHAAVNAIGYNDSDAVNELSYAALNTYVEDWEKDRTEEFLRAFSNYLKDLAGAEKIHSDTTLEGVLERASNVEISGMGELLKNNLEGVLSEYGESVSNEEKLAIVSALMKKLL